MQKVEFDEYIEVHEAEPMKELEEYISFLFFFEGMSIDEDVVNQVATQQQVLVTAKSHTMNVKLHLGTKLHSGVKLQTEVEAHSNSKISIHERNVELPNQDAHSDYKTERSSEETRVEPSLSKYVKIHHHVAQIIGDKDG